MREHVESFASEASPKPEVASDGRLMPDYALDGQPNPECVEILQKLLGRAYLVPTANKCGFMWMELDHYNEVFIDYAATARLPVLDVAVAYGFTTKKLLECGATVVANDLSEEMLAKLPKTLDENLRERLILMPGNALNLESQKNSLAGIMAAKVLHYLHPEDMRKLLRKFYDWLAPGGMLSATVISQHFPQCAQQVHDERAKRGAEWPGFFGVAEGEGRREQWCAVAPFFHFISPAVLRREVEKAGFLVQECDFFDAIGGAITGAGIIAIKPADAL